MNKVDTAPADFALFNLGFRAFFLGASVYSVVVMLFWTGIYAFHVSLPMAGLAAFQWHAHEMIYGYSMAVIAGFLLTAVRNWTGIQTIHGAALAVVCSFWLIARLLFLAGSSYIGAAGVFDLLFEALLLIAIAWPIVRGRNWRQLGILFKVMLLAAGNACFYLGYLGILEQGMYWGIYGGLYLVVGLILTMGGRVTPGFIERGVGYPVQLTDPKWITPLGLLLFLGFFISDLFVRDARFAGYAAAALFIVYSIRLTGWHTPGIWKKPLLWSLYTALLFIDAGFLLFALSVFTSVSKFLAIHAFAYGGIGLITVSMMARVALGHTGRNVNEPPGTVRYTLLLLALGALFRVLFPVFYPDHYLTWIIISQALWIAAFLLFVITYAPILIQPRIDGQFG